MNPEIKKLQDEVAELKRRIDSLGNIATIPYPVEHAFRQRLNIEALSDVPAGLSNAPLGAITAPTGGVTIDSEARTAINTIRSRLTALGLTL